MIEFATVARPYAKAIFELATEKGVAQSWSEGLKQLVWLVQQPQVVSIINQVDIDSVKKASELLRLLKDVEVAKSAEFKNFVSIVATEKRLLTLPNIFELYEEMVLASQNAQKAIIYTAYPVASEGQHAKIISDLEQHFHVSLQATFITEPELIGGIKVVVGDKVLDLSVQGKLKNLYTTLTN